MLQIKNKTTGEVFTIHKYILGSDGIESVWCNDWYGHHRIGFDCEWATGENDRAQVLVDALEKFISYHETGLLPARHVYEQAVAALEQWKSGKEVGDG